MLTYIISAPSHRMAISGIFPKLSLQWIKMIMRGNARKLESANQASSVGLLRALYFRYHVVLPWISCTFSPSILVNFWYHSGEEQSNASQQTINQPRNGQSWLEMYGKHMVNLLLMQLHSSHPLSIALHVTLLRRFPVDTRPQNTIFISLS